MPRIRARAKSPSPEIPAHRALRELDSESWAGARIARGGRRDALLGRVEALHLSLDGCTVEARVRGNRTLPYSVTIEVDGERPVARCTCSRESPGPCRHAVAALEALRFPSPAGSSAGRRSGRVAAGRGRIVQPAAPVPGFVIIGGAERTRTREERVAAAGVEARQTCRQRARRERARVEPLDSPDGPPRWRVSPRNGRPSRHVTLRGRGEEWLGCDCADYGENELRSCSHVERVRNERARQRKRDRLGVSESLTSVWWLPRAWQEVVPVSLSEVRVDAPAAVRRALDEFFDADGWLIAPPGGLRASAWARAACRAARDASRAAGGGWDLDPRAVSRIRAAAREERLARGGELAAADTPTWTAVLSRVRLRLHRYQERGARFLARRGRAFLADDMGLGKTVQAVVAALLLRERAGVRRALVVCPASLKYQWQQEIDKICGERATVIDGAPAARELAYRGWRDGFLVLNYELLLRDLDEIRRTAPELVVLDEAQRIKNWNTKTAKAVKRLASPRAFVLTGTPLENRLLELHSLVEFLHRRASGPRWRLLPFHAVTEPGGRVIAYEGLDVLRGRLAGFFLRRERSEVQDQLPARTDNTFWTGMSPAQLVPYRKHAMTAAAVLSKPPPLAPADVRALLRSLTSMRILCNALAQYDWASYEPLVRGRRRPREGREPRPLHSPKLEEFTRVLEDLLDESDRKVVVFSQWARMLRLAHYAVRDLLDRRDLRAEVFHGGLDSRSRSEMLEAFRSDPEFRVMFSTDAGGLGLNLQEAASIVVNLEVPWNPAVLEQRIGRVHRIGQRQSVQVLHFVTRGAIEERVRQVVESKRALFDGLLVDDLDRVVFDTPTGTSWVERARVLLGDVDAADGSPAS